MVRIGIGRLCAYVVCTPELTHQVLFNPSVFDKGGPLFERVREATGNGVLVCPYRDHRRQRRLLQPAFRRSRLAGYAAVMSQEIAAVTCSWRDGAVIDAAAAVQAITQRVAARTMFAVPLPGDVLARLDRAMTEVVRGMSRRVLVPAALENVPGLGKRRFERAYGEVRAITDRFVTEYRRNGVDHGDLLSMMLAAREDGRSLSEPEISDQAITMFGAGFETSAAALGWALSLVSRHPGVQQKLGLEADAVLGGRVATWDDLDALEYTRRIVTETLRLYPPGWLLTRTATVDTDLGGHPIPAGATVIYSPYLLHRRPEVFAEPERFDPDRWTRDFESGLPRGAFLPFGDGTRQCIAATFAMTEATLALASIAARWRLRFVAGPENPSRRRVTLDVRGLRIQLSERKPGVSSVD